MIGIITDPKSTRAEWQRTAYVDDDGTVYFPAAFSGNEQATFLCATHDGVGIIYEDDHVYVPIRWLMGEMPEYADALEGVEGRIRDSAERIRARDRAMRASGAHAEGNFIIWEGRRFTLAEARERFDVSPIIRQFGTWAVTEFGIECLHMAYPIEGHRASEPDWIEHMRGKTWVNLSDFVAALKFAQKRWGKQRKGMSKSKRFKVFKRDGYRCQICGATAQAGARLEVDHKVPRSKGGTHEMRNLWTLCFDCNRGKAARDL